MLGDDDAHEVSDTRSCTEGICPTRLWQAIARPGLTDGHQRMPSKQQCVAISGEEVYGLEAFKLPAVMSLATQTTVWYTRRRGEAMEGEKSVASTKFSF